MKAFWGFVAVVTGVVLLAPAEVHAGGSGVGQLARSGLSTVNGSHNDLLIGLLIAVGCALFSAALRRLPNS